MRLSWLDVYCEAHEFDELPLVKWLDSLLHRSAQRHGLQQVVILAAAYYRHRQVQVSQDDT